MTCLELCRDGETVTGALCVPGVLEIARHVWPCPVCKRRRRHVVIFDTSPWYAPRVMCCGCGDSWTEGELHERPFLPGWRKEATAKAKQYWADAFSLTDEQRREWFDSWRDEEVTS